MTKTQVYPAPLYEKKSRKDIFLHVFCKFLMRENGFTASNICKQTNTSVALLYGQSMVVIGTRRQVLSFLSGKTNLSLKHFIDLKHEINNYIFY